MKFFIYFFLSTISVQASINKDILSRGDLSIDQLFIYIEDARHTDWFFNDVSVRYLELAIECCEKNDTENAIRYINKSKEIICVFNLSKLRK